jgi:HD superfamily phosphohydrolase
MDIRDVIHGSIELEPHELPVVDSIQFQRLRHIRQVGFAEHSFPSATHNRFIHSLGAMEAATQAFDRIFCIREWRMRDRPLQELGSLLKFRQAVRLAALLHDVGHGPLSHTTEFAMPEVQALGLPENGSQTPQRKATHEDYTLKMVLDSSLTPLIAKAGGPMGVLPSHIAALLEPRLPAPDDFFIDQQVDFRPILSQLISSELDADRMDYLRRDSLHTGVSYGEFDFNWLVSNLTYHTQAGKCYLALQHRALYAFEDFLISRFHMFLMVYFHHKTVIYDAMLAQYLASNDCNYRLPADIEEYCQFDDAHLYAHLAQSKNPWARRIVHKQPYQILIEHHSGIPASPAAQHEQEALLNSLRQDLQTKNRHSLEVTSTSELSKYFRRPAIPIFVRYDDHYYQPRFIPLEECTDLFQRYQEKRTITRLYIAPEDFHLMLQPKAGF